ncbi:hypothetical protein RAZWK3B_18198 [Roseobacter sp. AzwK-3b]|nr:hypothetical protein RAZWK3B_18198 [Roseobacter sp. AzwK-3b]
METTRLLTIKGLKIEADLVMPGMRLSKVWT